MKSKTLLIGRKPVFEAIEQNKNIDRILISNKIDFNLIKDLLFLAKQNNIVIQKVPIEKINKITTANHQGIIAFLSIVDYYDLQSVIDLTNDKGETPLFLILDSITDVRNIGAIIRTAYVFGVNAIIIPETGVAPLREDTMKTSAGALVNLTICRVKYLQSAIKTLQLNGIKVIATDNKATQQLEDCNVNIPCAFVMGGEDNGIHDNILKLCDESIKIPFKNKFDSLNVSVSTGICLYSVFLKRNLTP